MSKTLVIAEKPSVAQDIVRALTPVDGKFEKGLADPGQIGRAHV